MPSFICKVMTPQGQITKVKMTEVDKITCLKKLKRNGMTPIEVRRTLVMYKPKSKASAAIYLKRKHSIKLGSIEIKLSNKVTLSEIRTFTEQFYFLRKSKFTIKHALTTIIKTTENENLRKILQDILKNVEDGQYIYITMEEYDSIFPLVYINLIKNGEITGFLDEALEHAITYLEAEEELKYKIKQKIMPNVVAFIGIIILLFTSIVIGIPLLQNLFVSAGGLVTLPKITIIVSKVCTFIVKRWYITFSILLILIGAFIQYISTDKGNYKIDKLKYTNAIWGKVWYFLDFSRLMRCIIINLENKMRIQDALEVSKNVVNNTYMLETIEASISNAFFGKSWIEPFEEQKFLSPIIIEMLKKETNSKKFEAMNKSIEYLDLQIEKEIEKLLKRLSRISYAIVGITLLLFVGIILIPCLSIYLGSFLFI